MAREQCEQLTRWLKKSLCLFEAFTKLKFMNSL